MSDEKSKQLAFRVGVAVLVVAVGVYGVAAYRIQYEVARDIWLLKVSGYGSVACLFATLLVTPLRKIAALFGRRWPVPLALALRRIFGICAALLGSLHGATALGTYLEGSWAALLKTPHLRLGVLALVVMLVLLVTSFPGPTRVLRLKLWRPLHRLSYVAALLVMLHLLHSSFASRTWTLGLFGSLLVVGLARVLPEVRTARRKDAPGARSETAAS